MHWTLQNLKDSENKQKILLYGSMFSAAKVLVRAFLPGHDSRAITGTFTT
jgi:hypothetical protein